jgi:ATP/maltotriose-dependent transcriptional regulator MalT/DNA-binding SARP family transcriptional activator
MLHLAKISSPGHEGIIPRERLFLHLDRLSEKKVTWISGPGGSGKTSLVTTYLNDRHLPHLWYNIDTGDDDIATFFYFMGLATRKTSPRFRKPLPLLTPEYLHGIPVFARRYFEEQFRRMRPPFTVVLDNLQDVRENSILHDILNIGFDSLPQGLRVIAISRNPPPEQYTRLRLQTHIICLGWNDIRLTLEETEAIVMAKTGGGRYVMPVSTCHTHIGGWVAGLVLLIEHIRKRESEGMMFDALAKEEIFPYFANEIIMKTDPTTRDFLLKTCFLPVMTPEMAQALTGISDAGTILNKLHTRNFFTERRMDKSPNYLYHTLFRDYLRALAVETFDEREVDTIRTNAAGILLEAGMVEGSAHLLIEAADWKALIPLILECAQSLLNQGRTMVLLGWIESVPVHDLSSRPWLLYWKGVALLPGDIRGSRECHEQAFHAFSQAGDELGMLYSWSGIVDSYIFESNDYKPLDGWINWFDSHVAAEFSFPTVESEIMVLSSMIGGCLFRQPDHEKLENHVRRLLELCQAFPDHRICPQTLSFAVLYYIWMGEFKKAGTALEYIKQKAESHSASPLMRITLKMIESLYALHSGESLSQIRKLTDEGMAMAENHGIHFMDFLILSQEGNRMLMDDDSELPGQYLEKFESAFTSDRRIIHCLKMDVLALNQLHRNDFINALKYAQRSEDLCTTCGLVQSQGKTGILLAQIYRGLGDRRRALSQLKSTENLFARIKSRYFLYACAMVKAHIFFDLGNPLAGMVSLKKALALGREGGYAFAPFVWRKNILSRLCAKALNAGIETEYVRNMIRKHNLIPDSIPLDIELWPWPVRIYTLGRFSLVVEGDSVSVTGKIQKKPLILLKALIALGGRDISDGLLADLLWPDSEGDAGHNAFTTTLTRLRRLLGRDDAILWEKGRITLNSNVCWVDRWAFERLCSRTETLADGILNENRETADQLKNQAYKVLKLYRDVFLSTDLDLHWTHGSRERLRNKYFRFLSHTASALSHAGDDEAAISYFRKGIEIEPLSEDLYQGLITLYLKLDRLAEALLTFKRCKQCLAAQSLPLSPKTRALKVKIEKA